MDNWSKLTSSISSLNIGSNAGKFAKGFSSSVQATRCVISIPLFVTRNRRGKGQLVVRVDSLVYLGVLSADSLTALATTLSGII